MKRGLVLCSGALLLLTIGFGSSWAQCIDPPYDVISWWTADGTPEDLADTNHGTLMGGMGFAAGMVDQCFWFDGVDDYVDAGNTIFARPDFPFSVDFWINVEAAENFYAIASTDVGGNGEYTGFRVYVSSTGTVITGIGNNLGCCAAPYRRNFFSPAGVITLNTWHHVAVVFESATSHLIYVDGAPQATTTSGTATTMAYAPNNTLEMGRVYAANTGTFTYAAGKLDEVELQQGILDPAKILEIYQAGAAGKCKDSPIATQSQSWGTVKSTFEAHRR
jgi:hypothetical protein